MTTLLPSGHRCTVKVNGLEVNWASIRYVLVYPVAFARGADGSWEAREQRSAEAFAGGSASMTESEADALGPVADIEITDHDDRGVVDTLVGCEIDRWAPGGIWIKPSAVLMNGVSPTGPECVLRPLPIHMME